MEAFNSVFRVRKIGHVVNMAYMEGPGTVTANHASLMRQKGRDRGIRLSGTFVRCGSINLMRSHFVSM